MKKKSATNYRRRKWADMTPEEQAEARAQAAQRRAELERIRAAYSIPVQEGSPAPDVAAWCIDEGWGPYCRLSHKGDEATGWAILLWDEKPDQTTRNKLRAAGFYWDRPTREWRHRGINKPRRYVPRTDRRAHNLESDVY